MKIQHREHLNHRRMQTHRRVCPSIFSVIQTPLTFSHNNRSWQYFHIDMYVFTLFNCIYLFTLLTCIYPVSY